MNKALHHPDTIKVRLRNQNKRRTPNATKVPDRPQLGSTTDQLERNNTKDKIFIELLLSLVASSVWFNGTCKLVLVVSVSHGDSAISHPRDQDYLSLWVGKGSEVELQQALAYMVANLRK